MNYIAGLIFGSSDFGKVSLTEVTSINHSYPALFCHLGLGVFSPVKLSIKDYWNSNEKFLSLGKVPTWNYDHSQEYLAATDVILVDNAKIVLQTGIKSRDTILLVINNSTAILLEKSHIKISVEKQYIITTGENEFTIITDTITLEKLVSFVNATATKLKNMEYLNFDYYANLRIFQKFFNHHEASEENSTTQYKNPLKILLENFKSLDIGVCLINYVQDNFIKIFGIAQNLDNSAFEILPQEIITHIGSYIEMDNINFI